MTWPSNYLAVSCSQCDLGQREVYKNKQTKPNNHTNQPTAKKPSPQTTKKPHNQNQQWAEILSLTKNKKAGGGGKHNTGQCVPWIPSQAC